RSGRSGGASTVALVAVAGRSTSGTLLCKEERGEVGRSLGVAVGVDVEGEDAHPGVVSDDAELTHAVHDLVVHVVDVGDDATDGNEGRQSGDESDDAAELKGEAH
ncbi:hypothetical protein PMAYCL1PPCAC_00142, partial [Pristionchus mayeri]